MKFVCIIQARRRSSRLPDKTLQLLSGTPVLAHVIKRCLAIPSIDQVICAGVDDPYEDPLFDIATAAGAQIFKGSEQDVLSRYYYAAKEAKADWVMRVTSDCPLFDPLVAENTIQRTWAEKAQYGGNGGWPHGLDCEVFTFDLLEQAFMQAKSDSEREHVTLWMKRKDSVQKAGQGPPPADPGLVKNQRWVIDYPEDYAFLDALHQHLGQKANTGSWQDVMATVAAHPELNKINENAGILWAQETARIHKEA